MDPLNELSMELLNRLYMINIMHSVSSALLAPTVILLMAFIVYSLYSVGSVLVELFVERKKYRAVIPELVARLDGATPEALTEVVDGSGLLRTQKDDLDELISYMYLPEDARTEVAKRLLANENDAYKKALGRTDIASRIAPMLGLMGTLIPLGPGLVALGEGDTATLASSLMIAFDTTVAGLATAVVCFVVSWVRRRWYSDYLVSMEALFNTLLEKAGLLHAQGFKFKPTVLHYDKSGRKAKQQDLPVSTSDATSRAVIDKAAGSAREAAAARSTGRPPTGAPDGGRAPVGSAQAAGRPPSGVPGNRQADATPTGAHGRHGQDRGAPARPPQGQGGTGARNEGRRQP